MRSTRRRFATQNHDHGDRLLLCKSVERVALNGAFPEVLGHVLSGYLQKREMPKASRSRISGTPLPGRCHHLTHYERVPTYGMLDYTMIVPVSVLSS